MSAGGRRQMDEWMLNSLILHAFQQLDFILLSEQFQNALIGTNALSNPAAVRCSRPRVRSSVRPCARNGARLQSGRQKQKKWRFCCANSLSKHSSSPDDPDPLRRNHVMWREGNIVWTSTSTCPHHHLRKSSDHCITRFTDQVSAPHSRMFPFWMQNLNVFTVKEGSAVFFHLRQYSSVPWVPLG